MYGFYRIAAAVPKMKVADVGENTKEIIRCARKAETEGAGIVLFPELCITGYTCGDLFHQTLLLNAARKAVTEISDAFSASSMLLAVGLPLLFRGKLYNCAALLQSGKILGIIPKIVLPNQREFYEKRHFSSGRDIAGTIHFESGDVPFSAKQIFESDDTLKIGVELCEDLWSPLPPSQFLSVNGANMILNLSASNALVSKAKYRKELVCGQSARCMAVYAYTSSGIHESTTDTVYGGHSIIAENGTLLAENKRFERESSIVYADIDAERLNMSRISEGSFQEFGDDSDYSFVRTATPLPQTDTIRYRCISPTPFVPGTAHDRDEVCTEIFHIQTSALAKRMEHSGVKKAVIGISGGLDSTLALLVTARTFELLKLDPKGILAITMPGFGTTSRTLNNSIELTRLLGGELRQIDIRDACMKHFSDIGHNPEELDVTYENVQARERTQILMDTANREGGLVVGTGDLSEIALGWSTYNADHMSMYAVNCGVPKTLVRHLVAWFSDHAEPALSAVLLDIIDTPVSPELLPAGADGGIVQKTESILGAYELHDFYLYHTIKYGASPAKLRFLAGYAFGEKYEISEIDRTLNLFFRRFFSQQFKRSCIPDGPKVGSISLSPRADWRMPSDASSALWIKQ